jgi:WD40 repeat protein
VSRGVHVRNFYSLIVADGYSTPRLAWSPCGRWAYVTSQDRAVVVLEVPSGRSVHRITGHQVNVRDVATHPVTGQLLTCSFDKSCRVWNPIADKQAHAAGDAAASASASS